ncbi:hypothetical protein VNO77_31400 [Canavalia gladiata]|uniref:Uncharacterized protein n=1 Tax=Canavalia gladiata TaxID=3824 RepID=A0AAN9Q1R5_CANGL
MNHRPNSVCGSSGHPPHNNAQLKQGPLIKRARFDYKARQLTFVQGATEYTLCMDQFHVKEKLPDLVLITSRENLNIELLTNWHDEYVSVETNVVPSEPLQPALESVKLGKMHGYRTVLDSHVFSDGS